MAGYYHACLLPWRKYELVTMMPIEWYRETVEYAVRWAGKLLAGRPWAERFRDELKLREHVSMWRHRLQLWPRWWLTVLTGRSFLP